MNSQLFKILFPLFSLLSISTSQAQTLFGYIKSSAGEPIPNAALYVLNTTKGTYTDSMGFYQLALNSGNHQIAVNTVGYAVLIQSIDITGDSLRFDVILSEQAIGLGEVMITANKKEERAFDLAGSITVLSAEKIEAGRIWELNQLVGAVPNLQYGNLGVRYQQQIAIRGISVFSENPSVATYIDGVNAMDIAANGLMLFDVERIELLRGPQGTIYGRNAMGGVLNIITKAPSNFFEGFAETSIGNQGLIRTGLSVKTPLVKNKLFLGLSGLFQQQNGFYINDLSDKTSFLHDSLKGTPEDGQRMGDERAIYGNLHLKWIPSSKLLLSYNSKIESDKSIGASSYYQAVENDSIALAKPYTFAVNSLGSDARLVWNNSLALKYFHPQFNFISTSAYQHLRQAYHHIDQDLWPYDYATGSTYGRNSLGAAFPQQVWSQEIRFSNSKEKGLFDWTAGTYAFYQRNNKQYATVYERLALLFGQEPGIEVNKNDMHNLGISLFGQIAKSFWQDRIKVVAGLRYDFEQRSAVIAKFRVDSLGNRDYIVADTSKSKGFQALSPLLSGSYYLNAHQNIYLSYKRGFRAGGTNYYTKLSEYEFYLPEYSDNFELGYKLQSVNRKYALNLALFFMHWQNLQLDMQPEPGAWVVSNIGKVNSMGAELECSAKPFKGFSADFSLGITDARYLGFDYLGQDIKGNRAILAPTHTAFLAIQQDLPIAKKFLISLRVETRHTGKQYFDLVNSIEQLAYWLFNGQASFGNKHFRLSFWVQNIGQTTYIAYAMPGYFKSTLLNRPRSFGLSLSTTF